MARSNDVVHMIRAQTDYRIVYSEKLFENTPEIGLKKGELNIEKLLNRISEKANVYIEIGVGCTIIRHLLRET
jgi:hypothetical protein